MEELTTDLDRIDRRILRLLQEDGRLTNADLAKKVNVSTPESFATFETAIATLPFVLDCHLVAGDFDYFLKIRVRDIADFNRLHGDQLIALPGVRQTRTFFVMKEVIDNAPLDF